MTDEAIADHLRSEPPACVRPFRYTPAPLPRSFGDAFHTTWHLACRCGGESGRVFGHRLDGLNPQYKGDLIVGPLAFECASCGRVTGILDTERHGYHPEVDKLAGQTGGSAKVHGVGRGTAYPCPSCAADRFTVDVGFVYWDFDLMHDEPDAAWEAFFNEFLMCCTCVGCGTVSVPTEFGKL
jgi:hypothetical protein